MNYNLLGEPFRIFEEGDKMITILPRTPDEIYIPAKRKKDRRIWTYPISIWAKKYKFETEDMLRKCFEKDWSQNKI
jgi:hypothetical protein